MGRKKNNNQEEERPENKLKFDLASDAKRGVAAVALFALALVIFLSFFGKAGVAGGSLDKSIGVMIGWTKWVFPFFLILAGIVLLLRKETSFYVAKLAGLFVVLVSLAGFFHWFFDIGKMLKAAKAGSGGGYLGYTAAYLSVRYLGPAGGLVAILALLLIGIIIAFNFSIINFIEKLFQKEASAEEGQEDGGKNKEEKNKKSEEDKNIGKIEFVEGPDQYVDEKLLDKISKGVATAKKTLSPMKEPGEEYVINTAVKSTEDNWQFPPLDLLEKKSGVAKGGDTDKNAEIIEKTLRHFGIEVERGEIKTGPSVTQYSFRPAVGVKISRILALQNDLSLALAAHPIRIEAPIPGKSLIGIEVPNKESAMVRLRDILESVEFLHRKSNLILALGEDVSGNYIFGDLDKMPHLMIAGATGTGKSVCINTIITTLLYQNSPRDLKFIMVDPKRVELSLYNGIPHLLSDVIVDNGKVLSALKWAVGEMERRYRQLQDSGSRDINSYNEKARSGKTKRYIDPETGESVEEKLEKLPYIVIIVDELADLMGSHGREVEGAVVRLAQMARAVGIHLIVSTQRPSVEVITGLIKANITTRIAFQVATQIDSRTILDMAGSEKLLGNGDMLYLSAASPKPKRLQGIFVSESEVKRVTKFVKNQKANYGEEIGEDITSVSQGGALEFKDYSENSQEDEFFEAAKAEVERAGKASASLLQRRLRVGYARAARLLDIMEDKGIIGPADGAKPREVYTSENTPHYEDNLADQGERDKWNL